MIMRIPHAGMAGVVAVFACALVTSAGARTVAAPEATVSGFAPTQAIVGQLITIGGQNLDGTRSVMFGTVAAQSVSVDPYGTWVKAVVPAGVSPGSVYMTLDVSGSAQSIGPLRINAGSMPPQPNPQPTASTAGTSPKVVLAPRITFFTPTAGHVGTLVKIHGANLTGTRWVSFGGIRTTHVINLSGSAVTVKVPLRAHSGKLLIHTTGGTSRSMQRFRVVPASAPGV
jgi:hypothetical protein